MPECRAVELVLSALGDGRDLARLAEFRIVVHAIHADLRDGLSGREGIDERRVGSDILRRDAVHGGFCLGGQSALHGKARVRRSIRRRR